MKPKRNPNENEFTVVVVGPKGTQRFKEYAWPSRARAAIMRSAVSTIRSHTGRPATVTVYRHDGSLFFVTQHRPQSYGTRRGGPLDAASHGLSEEDFFTLTPRQLVTMYHRFLADDDVVSMGSIKRVLREKGIPYDRDPRTGRISLRAKR